MQTATPFVDNDADDGGPVAIGGVGGSGTRLVAKLIRQCGIYLGSDINESEDCLWFTLLFKRIDVLTCTDSEFDVAVQGLIAGLSGVSPISAEARQLLLRLSAVDRPQHRSDWLQLRARSLITAAAARAQPGRWGWKEPNTHMVIERLWLRLPALRYVHVVRNGFDMAFSQNQNQLELWGPTVLGEDGSLTPRRSLAYWCCVHRRIQALIRNGQHRVYWLDYDELCRSPKHEMVKLKSFLGCSSSLAADLNLQIVGSAARARPPGLEHFEEADVEYVHSLGYN